MQDYLPKLKKSIKTGKIVEATTLLAGIRDRHPLEKEEVLSAIALASDKTAFALLSWMTGESHRDPEIHDRLIQLVTDRAHLNFSFSLILFENADRQIIIHATPLLKHILSNETDKKVLSAVIRTAGKLKIDGLVQDLAEFIFYDDLKLKSDAVNALERIGSSGALEKLEQAAKTEKCDQDILDAIHVLTGDLKEPEETVESQPQEPPQIRDIAVLTSKSVEKRFDALVNFSEEGVDLARALSQKDHLADHDLMINLLRLVSRTIPLDAVNPLFDIIKRKKTHPNIKFLAYNALGAYPELESAASVLQGLNESAMHVRLAAIKVLDKNLTDFVCAEVKNKIESGTKKGELLAQAILDANAKNLIEFLMVSDTFSYMASNYLSKAAPLSSLQTFIDILQSRKLRSTAKKYADIREQRNESYQNLFIVVSSSNAILDVYSKLIFACGFSCQTFARAQEAFEAIAFEEPRAVICDLFLNDLTGIDLCREVRQLYPKDQVPVIISTLQRNLDARELDNELERAGANACCEFPAKSSQIKSWGK